MEGSTVSIICLNKYDNNHIKQDTIYQHVWSAMFLLLVKNKKQKTEFQKNLRICEINLVHGWLNDDRRGTYWPLKREVRRSK